MPYLKVRALSCWIDEDKFFFISYQRAEEFLAKFLYEKKNVTAFENKKNLVRRVTRILDCVLVAFAIRANDEGGAAV